jgi:peptide chain release factor 1
MSVSGQKESELIEKLEGMAEEYDRLTNLLADPAVTGDPHQYRTHASARAAIERAVQKYHEYQGLKRELDGVEEMLRDEKDAGIIALAEEEKENLSQQLAKVVTELHEMLVPRDPRDDSNVVMEIRAGVGGHEAGLFAGDLFRMYQRYVDSKGWRTDVINSHPGERGGFKEVVFLVEGKGVYRQLKYESGVHRVQRVPQTEASGRLHTSAVTVAVLPEPEEVEVEIDRKDLKREVFRASGPGGQNVNKVSSAVRLTHIPTGIVASCQDEQSQHKNYRKALRVLRARILDKLQSEQEAQLSRERKSQVRSGDRSEKVRTYNFPQSRLSDHRIGLTLHKLDRIIDGDIQELIDALQAAERQELAATL